jgi:YggT family protein
MNQSQFLVNIIFDLLIFVFILRFLFYIAHASFYNPITQFVVKITQPVVKPLQRFFPRQRYVEWAVIFCIIVLGCIKVYVMFGLFSSEQASYGGVILYSIVYSIFSAINKILTFYFYAIIVQAILSWFPPIQRNLIYVTLTQLTQPVLNLFRRFIPLLGPVDLSPLVAIIVIKLVQSFIIYPVLLM